MREALSFPCEGETLVATLDRAQGNCGLLIVTGGRQTRIGPHRMMAKLAAEISLHGVPVFRFDRRGTGDSSGIDPGFLASAPDIMAATTAFGQACPGLDRIWGLGLCDAASALGLFGAEASLYGLLLLNPWVVEAEPNAPAPEAIRAHYYRRLTTVAGWRALLTRGFNPLAATRGMRKALRKSNQQLADDVMAALVNFQGPKHILIAEQDATARAFMSMYQGVPGAALRRSGSATLTCLDSASHSFASPADHEWLVAQVLAALSDV